VGEENENKIDKKIDEIEENNENINEGSGIRTHEGISQRIYNPPP
jgi:uncharacterized protein YggL (DUF469 family)